MLWQENLGNGVNTILSVNESIRGLISIIILVREVNSNLNDLVIVLRLFDYY